MGSPRRHYIFCIISLSDDTVYRNTGRCLTGSYINRRRMRQGGGPLRYTGWTVPSYSQSQQQYGYTTDQNAYNMNNYPPGRGQYSYQGQPQNGNYPPEQINAPGYYDATRTQAGNIHNICPVDNTGGYQPPAYPPTAGKTPVWYSEKADIMKIRDGIATKSVIKHFFVYISSFYQYCGTRLIVRLRTHEIFG